MRLIVDGRDRAQAGRTAPAGGLYLMQVEFGRSDEREERGDDDDEA
jgi:tRNA U38,U39,U40 pseudouridine synthase TruA